MSTVSDTDGRGAVNVHPWSCEIRKRHPIPPVPRCKLRISKPWVIAASRNDPLICSDVVQEAADGVWHAINFGRGCLLLRYCLMALYMAAVRVSVRCLRGPAAGS